MTTRFRVPAQLSRNNVAVQPLRSSDNVDVIASTDDLVVRMDEDTVAFHIENNASTRAAVTWRLFAKAGDKENAWQKEQGDLILAFETTAASHVKSVFAGPFESARFAIDSTGGSTNIPAGVTTVKLEMAALDTSNVGSTVDPLLSTGAYIAGASHNVSVRAFRLPK